MAAAVWGWPTTLAEGFGTGRPPAAPGTWIHTGHTGGHTGLTGIRGLRTHTGLTGALTDFYGFYGIYGPTRASRAHTGYGAYGPIRAPIRESNSTGLTGPYGIPYGSMSQGHLNQADLGSLLDIGGGEAKLRRPHCIRLSRMLGNVGARRIPGNYENNRKVTLSVHINVSIIIFTSFLDQFARTASHGDGSTHRRRCSKNT